MPEIACPSCGTSYDTSGFEPGQRFRCHGDACTERLTVPEAGAPAPSRSETPTPAPIAAAPAAATPAAPAAPAANDYASDDDVLEAKAPAGGGGGGKKKRGKRRRGGTGRRAAPPEPDPRDERRSRANVPPPKSPAPMYAAIGGVGLLIVILAIVMLQKPVSPKKIKKPKKRFKEAQVEDVVVPSKSGGEGEQPVEVEEEKPKPVKKPRKSKYDYTFVEDAGFKSTFEKYLKDLYHDDPNIAQDAADTLFDKGSKEQLCNAILNHLPKMNFTKLEDRTVASMLMDIVSDALGDGAKEAVGDVAVVTPNMNAKIGYQDAMRAWRAYWRDNGGKVAGE